MKQNSNLDSDMYLSPGQEQVQTIYLVCDSNPLKTCSQRLLSPLSYSVITNTFLVTFYDLPFHQIY